MKLMIVTHCKALHPPAQENTVWPFGIHKTWVHLEDLMWLVYYAAGGGGRDIKPRSCMVGQHIH